MVNLIDAFDITGGSSLQESTEKCSAEREFDCAAYLYGLVTKGMTTTVTTAMTTVPSPATKVVMQTENLNIISQTLELTRVESPHQQQQPPPPRPQAQQKIRGPSSGGSRPFPRAIRGSGANESSKDHIRNEKKTLRSHKDKLTDEQVWSAKQNTGSKIWGHDDRFDNDYE